MKVIGQSSGDGWELYHGDTVDVARGMPDKSADFSVFSPPFASLYTYSASARDLGNVRDDAEFFGHYDYLIAETARVMRPGRLVAIHCMTMPTSKERDGHIGLRDFRGDIIRAYQKHGFIFHSEVCIWKDPVTAMQRTKALGLLHKTIRKDSAMSRQGLADYLVIMRTPGTNETPIAHTHETFPVERWQRYASTVWATLGPVDDEGFATVLGTTDPRDDSSTINPSDTLQYRSAREHEDERHICPLQLEVIRRAMRLWSNPGDVVWSPFAGIGSEGYVAIQEGRRFVGAELKRSYYEQAARNLASAKPPQASLFGAAS
jgi:DNA modification methylase